MKIFLQFTLTMLLLDVGAAWSQAVVSGKVMAKSGETLPGVNVVEKGTTNGTATNANGEFKINTADENATLVFSFIGFTTQEVKVNNRQIIDITLEDDTKTLSEIVVIGYGSVERKNLTYSVGSLASKDIKEQPVSNFQQALQGKIAGVQVMQPSGKPGSAIRVSVRNSSSITASNDPIYVIDGVISLSTDGINPDDIESIEVLKDAAAQSIYGSRGANGVVLLTTKKGKSGKLQVSVSQQSGFTEVGRKLNLLNSEQFVSYINDAVANARATPITPDKLKTDINTDWQKEIYGKVSFSNTQVSVGSGTDKYAYYLSVSHLTQNGVINPSDFSRSTLRLNNEYKLSTSISIGTNLGLSRLVTADNVGDGSSGPVLLTLSTVPNIPIRNPDGTYARNLIKPGENPVAVVRGGGNKNYTNKYLGNIYFETKLPYHFKFRTSYGVDVYNSSNDYNLDPEITLQGNLLNGEPRNTTSDEFIWLWDNTLAYSKTFNKKHEVNVVAGHSAQRSDFTEGSRKSLWSYDSYFARGNYDYEAKYLLSASIRRESSSRFGPDNRIGIFPAVSAAWRVSEESFMRSVPFINNLKLRASYGQTGNSQGFGDFAYLGRRGRDANYPINDISLAGTALSTITNNQLGWENIAQSDVGVDATLFRDRISISADYYVKTTKDLILDKELPVTSGFSTATLNAGQLSSRGIELTLNTRNIVTTHFTWSSTVVYASSRVKVDRLIDKQKLLKGAVGINQPAVIIQEGESLGNFYGYVAQGVNPRTGDIDYKDVNKNGVSSVGESFDPEDRTIIGNALPKFTLGFTNTFTYHSFDLTVFLDGVFGHDIFNATRIATEGMYTGWNQTTETLHRWKKEGDITDMPRALYNDVRNIQVSTRFIERGDYVKLRSFTVGYTFTKAPPSLSFMQGSRVYVSGRNIFTSTNYRGYDPEANAPQFGTSGVVQGIDYGVYPQVRTFTIGVNVKF
jgi:TonB-dependent starch-binding outer membrane protein SusC